MKYAVVYVPAAAVRKKPDHRSEMVNQLLFGEAVKVIKEKKVLWSKVQSLHDGYEGWVQRVMLLETDVRTANTRCDFVVADMFGKIKLAAKKLHVPAGSTLPFLENKKGRLGAMQYSFSGNYIKRDESPPSAERVEELSNPWLGVPYLWGGRTPMGVDCSGLVQVVFKQMGIDLPRDTWQQAEEGKLVKKFKQAKPGDLAFFTRNGRIIHVGIVLSGQKIIHSSGKVRIDELTKRGIVHAESGKLLVKLERIKRLF
jgi:hypothetical protein